MTRRMYAAAHFVLGVISLAWAIGWSYIAASLFLLAGSPQDIEGHATLPEMWWLIVPVMLMALPGVLGVALATQTLRRISKTSSRGFEALPRSRSI